MQLRLTSQKILQIKRAPENQTLVKGFRRTAESKCVFLSEVSKKSEHTVNNRLKLMNSIDLIMRS